MYPTAASSSHKFKYNIYITNKEPSQKVFSLMLNETNKKIIENTVIQHSLMYPDATIRDFLNMRRTTKDKCCLIIFLLYSFGMILMMGVGFFYGNYNTVGLFTNAAAANQTTCASNSSTPYVSEDYLSCISTCSGGQLYLSAVCITSNITVYSPDLSTQVLDQVSMYDIKYTLPMLSYVTIGLLVVTGILFLLLIYFSKLLYVYILVLFLMLLGFSFYLLKLVQLRITQWSIGDTSIFYVQDQKMRYIAFTLLAIYLIIFPFVLFSPQKIKIAIALISSLREYFSAMLKMNLFTFFVILIAWGSFLLQIFLVVNFYSAGTISTTPTNSMFYTFTDIDLSHPASLTFHFIGVFWIFGTFISWHKYFVNSGICLWYFQESQGVYTLRRALRRSLHHVGSAAIDAILMPVQWILLVIYSITKPDHQEEEEQPKNCVGGCLLSMRQFFAKLYSKINSNSPSSAVLTNMPFFESCTMSHETFSLNHHRFFNIGGTVQIFTTLFTVMLWVMIFFFIIYYQVYNKTFPPPISSLNLPILSVFLMAILIGSLYSNIFAASIDCLIFCYLTQRKGLIENGMDEQAINREQFQVSVKETLDDCYFRSQEYAKYQKYVYIYQQTDENTLQLNYISRKQ